MVSPSSVFEATLQDVSKADAPAEIIATTKSTGSQGPDFHFSLDYDPRASLKIIPTQFVPRSVLQENPSTRPPIPIP